MKLSDLESRVGETIDRRYKLLRIIGYGGMGAVFEAEHVVIKRPHAIKLLHPALGERKDIAQRFEREAIATGRLRHPSCVEVSDFGRLPDGALYLVMELLRGESLGDALEREGAFPLPRAIRIMRQVLLGLEHAHSLDIVHRDIKPDNILLVERGGERDAVKLVDFGIAKLLGGSAEEQAQLTQIGFTVGTPRYMAPEQAMGGEIDGRTDLYAATVVLFQMIAGETPFTGEPVQMITAHVTKPPPRLADVAQQPISPELEAVVQRGLAKERGDRFTSAREYLTALEACALPGASPAPPPVVVHTPPPVAVHTPPPVHTPVDFQPTLSLRSGEATAHVAALAAPRRRRFWPTALLIAGALAALGVGISLCTGGGSRLESLLRDLERKETCELRRDVVNRIAELGDPKAIPALKKARALGENSCLRSEAARAIDRLQRRAR